ncbi:MAG: thymidylate kinase [Bacilli bacterium]|nr:thymidylate kinase [Bacilli bacterium]MDD3895875.1 thymidylate kinase [Bacilli bacterium]MDD4407763.1 thymidylate kinase [Bacilli bacterium]
MQGKIIVIEGTDCSGKETQARLLVDKLNKEGKKIVFMSFPMYDTPTGEIIAANILGKSDYGKCTFPEGTTNIPPKVAALYYAADRLYNVNLIREYLDQGYIIIMDRYVESNMGHQGAKFDNENDKIEMLLWLEHLEFQMLDLPKPDKVIFLYLPYKYGKELRCKRKEKDGAERDSNHLINAEKTYFLMAERYKFNTINCVANKKIRPIEDINNELYDIVSDYIAK